MKLEIRRGGLMTALEMNPESPVIKARLDEMDRVIKGLTDDFELDSE